jgi:TRAP-type uncharacterized transport system substrate-binding protein
VSFGPAGSASSLTGTIVFQRLGVQVEQALYDNPTALQKLKTGELSALVRVIGKPIDFFAKIPANSGLHFVPIPFSKTFADYYTVGELTNKEYPALIPAGQSVDTIAAPAVLAVFNGRREMIATDALNDSSRAFSRNGTSFASLRATQSGATSISPRPFRAGRAGALRRTCCAVFAQRTPSTHKWLAAIFPPS